jgi:glutamine synthetase
VGNFTLGGLVYEQNEIEFLPVRVEEAADQLMIAKWVIRNLGYKLGYNITFAPKITTGKAGSGLHIHMRMMKDGKNCMLDNGVLSDKAKTAIAGMMELAQSITAFGKQEPDVVLPPCTTPRGTDKRMLGATATALFWYVFPSDGRRR